MTDAERRFPIQGGCSVLWSVIAPHEEQAQQNHRQTLVRLAERGGLSPGEFYLVMSDRPLREYRRDMDENRGHEMIANIVEHELTALAARVALLEAEHAAAVRTIESIRMQCEVGEDYQRWFDAINAVTAVAAQEGK